MDLLRPLFVALEVDELEHLCHVHHVLVSLLLDELQPYSMERLLRLILRFLNVNIAL